VNATQANICKPICLPPSRQGHVSSPSDLAEAREEIRESWSAALRMIRETVETLGPPGILPSQDAVLEHYDPEPVYEATVIVEALRKMLA
jgi:hypothetical protein